MTFSNYYNDNFRAKSYDKKLNVFLAKPPRAKHLFYFYVMDLKTNTS